MCPFRWRARSESATVPTTASLEPRPSGTSKACVQAGNGWELRSSGRIGHCDVGSEIGFIDPNAVKDHPDPLCQGDHGALCATAAGNLRDPCSQPSRTATVHFLKFPEEILDQVQPFVDVTVEVDGEAAVGFRRDGRLYSGFC